MADRSGGSRQLSYDPGADAALRYPTWTVAEADLGGVIPEVLSVRRRVILVERASSPAVRRCSLAHAIAHLDLGHGAVASGWFEAREEAAADALAAARLIPLPALSAALAWSRDRAAIAAELEVDAQMLSARERGLSDRERRQLRRTARVA